MHAHVVRHVVRRGVEEVMGRQSYIQRLQQDAEAYENAGPDMEVQPAEMLPMVITVLLGLVILCSLEYTIGQVMTSLAMIESPSATAVVESKPPPPYTDLPDKELLLPEADELEPADIEVTVIPHKPVTSSLRATIGLLHRVGGFTARWRGLGYAILYSIPQNALAHLIGRIFDIGLIGESVGAVMASVLCARLHMAWTHAMIAHPKPRRWRSGRTRKECGPLYFATFIYAVNEQAALILPLAVAFTLGLVGPDAFRYRDAVMESGCPKAMLVFGLKVLAVPATYAFVGLALLFPSSVALTRVEALLLPDDEEPIVPFDKEALTADVDMDARGASGHIFNNAWRSFDRASRWRVIKLYIKLYFAQVMVVFAMVHLVFFELFVLGPERIATFVRAASAQIKLMIIEAHKAHAHPEGH